MYIIITNIFTNKLDIHSSRLRTMKQRPSPNKISTIHCGFPFPNSGYDQQYKIILIYLIFSVCLHVNFFVNSLSFHLLLIHQSASLFNWIYFSMFSILNVSLIQTDT